MSPVKNEKSLLSSELENIALIRAAELAKGEALAKARKSVSDKLAAAAHEAETVKERVINAARAERKRMVQQAIDQAKSEVKANIIKQEHASQEMVSLGEKWVGSAVDYAVKYILGVAHEDAE